jgi:hypothetical protein
MPFDGARMKDFIEEVAGVIALAAIALMFATLVIGPAGKTIATYHAERDACLIGARNGLEIERCSERR